MNSKETAESLLPVIAYGDAAGLPFEAQLPVEEGSIQGLEDTKTNPFIGQYPPGTWSDDTHLSLAVAKSIVEADGFSLESQAGWHVLAYRHVTGAGSYPDLVPPIVTSEGQNGWGHSTTSSMQRLIDDVPPETSGHPNGSGNGVLMKMAPLALWQIANKINTPEAEQQLVDLTKMTHESATAIVSSLTHKRYLERLSQGEDPSTALVKAYEEAPQLENYYDSGGKVTQSLGRVARDDFLDEPSREKILAAIKGEREDGFFGFFAPDTLAMAYGSFVIEQELPDSIFRAVELGGDSDSVGSIVAAMGLFAGESTEVSQMPGYDKVFDVARLGRISRELAETIG